MIPLGGFMTASAMQQGLLVMGLGMGGVFVTLVIFYGMILVFNRLLKDKPDRDD
jgi:hypothetical protein